MPPRRSNNTRKPSVREQAIANGYRSGLEDLIGEQLRAGGIPFLYEEFAIPFSQPAKPRKYTPDFLIPNAVVVESKGRFLTADRQKHLLVQAQYPQLDLRFVFSNSRTRISKQSKTTYADWCEAKGFLYADRIIPQAWLREKLNRPSLDTLMGILGPTKGPEILSKFNVL